MKKLMTALLCVMLIACMMPTMAFADGEGAVVAEIEGTGYTTLSEALEAASGEKVVIELVADATLNYKGITAYGAAGTTSITINGNGHTLTLNQLDPDGPSIGMANTEGKLILNDLAIVKTGEGETGGAWNKHAINWNCDVEMKNVTVDHSISFSGDATLNNVTINEDEDYYAIWVRPNGQTVIINGLTVNAGRGIKIDDQYVIEAGEVTLKVENATFDTEKKAAITVESEGGAVITLGNNVDITGVNADSNNAVWANDSEVFVNGKQVSYAPISVSTDEQLKNALASEDENVVIELQQDVELEYKGITAYGAGTKTITINGNGHTLTLNQLDPDGPSIGMANPYGKLILNKLTINKTGQGATSGAWNKHAINWNCAVEMNDVTVNNSVAFAGDAELNTVTINEAGDYYAIWVRPNGQTVDINGLTVNAGRGIKIDDQYVIEVEKVTLNVENATFDTENKAAILVKTTAGADITASNVDISKTADQVNLVWWDEDYKDNEEAMNKVTVTGGKFVQEATREEILPPAPPAPSTGGYYPVTTPLAQAQAAANTAVSTYVNAADYTAEAAAEIAAIVADAKTDIAAAKTVEEVKAIEEAAKAEIDKIETAAEEAEIAAIAATKFAAKSKMTTLNGKTAIKVTWNVPEDQEFDGYEVFRSVKRYSGFGTKPIWTTAKTSYTNNKGLESGNTYYYKVRGWKMVNDEIAYTDWSYKAWRTVE